MHPLKVTIALPTCHSQPRNCHVNWLPQISSNDTRQPQAGGYHLMKFEVINLHDNFSVMNGRLLTHWSRALFWPILPLVAAFLAFCNSQKLCFPFPPYPSVIYQFHHWDVYSRSMPLVLSKNEYSKKYRLETKPYFFTFQLI